MIPQYTKYWRTIGSSLGIPNTRLDIINLGNHYVEEKFQKMLMDWLKVDPSATWRKIITVIDGLEVVHGKIFSTRLHAYTYICTYQH